jgi:hypothetical protein
MLSFMDTNKESLEIEHKKGGGKTREITALNLPEISCCFWAILIVDSATNTLKIL